MLRPSGVRLLRGTLFVVALAATNAFAAVITVDSLADTVAADGVCTLREAITNANSNSQVSAGAGECAAGTAGLDEIRFSVAGTIRPTSVYPTITSPIHFNGYSAPGAGKNTLPLAQGTNAVLKIEIDGVDIGNAVTFFLEGAGASGTIIEGLVFNNSANQTCCAQSAILLRSVGGGSNTIIRGNFFSTDVTGTERRAKGSGNVFADGGNKNLIVGSAKDGPLDDSARNLISGGQNFGLVIQGEQNVTVRGNLFGTDATGRSAIPNGSTAINGNVVDLLIAENVISGNNGTGINLRPSSKRVVIRNNLIGVDAGGVTALPNNGYGILIADNSNTANQVVSDFDIDDNVVAYNQCPNCSAGITIGNFNPANTATGIRLARNLVYANSGLQIDLFTGTAQNQPIFGVTPNDLGDGDTIGGNAFQNFPVLSPATANGALVQIPFTLNSNANRIYKIEFFQVAKCDANGHGGAYAYLGAVEAVTNGAGNATGTATLVSPLFGGFISATATNQTTGTSEFSECVVLSTSGSATPPPNYQGLFWRFPAGSEAGWGINFAHQGDVVFATWFTYDQDGKPTWFAAVLQRVAAGIYTGDVFTTTGPAYDALPWDPATVVETVVGAATVTFADNDNATFDYTVNGVTQSKPITRQLFAQPAPGCVWGGLLDLGVLANLQDLWWNYPAGSQSGWGANFTHQGNIVFVTWFTYGADGKPTWFIAVAEKKSANTYQGPLSTVTGPPFSAVPWDPANVVETVVGTLQIVVSDGNRATYRYTINGVEQTKDITRQVFVTPGTGCIN